ncbi:MAG: hydrogenase maturation protease [Armatimonadota bacterium]
MADRIVVLGVGNELRSDDAVGVIVARRIADLSPMENVTVVEGHTGGLNLLFDLEEADWAIIVDALDLGTQPGTVAVFEADEADVRVVERAASLHHVSLADVLELARLSGLTTRVTIVGVQPDSTLPGDRLSDAVANRVDELVDIVWRLITQTAAQAGQSPAPGPEEGYSDGAEHSGKGRHNDG